MTRDRNVVLLDIYFANHCAYSALDGLLNIFSTSVDDLWETSWRPCWRNFNTIISLASVVCGTNMAALSLSFETQGIGWQPSTRPLKSIGWAKFYIRLEIDAFHSAKKDRTGPRIMQESHTSLNKLRYYMAVKLRVLIGCWTFRDFMMLDRPVQYVFYSGPVGFGWKIFELVWG